MIESKRANKLRYFEATIGKRSNNEWNDLFTTPFTLIRGVAGYSICLYPHLLALDSKRLTLWNISVPFVIENLNAADTFVTQFNLDNAGYFKQAGSDVLPPSPKVKFAEGPVVLKTDIDYSGQFEGYVTFYGYYTLLASEN